MLSARLLSTTTSRVCPVAVTRTVIFSAFIRWLAWALTFEFSRLPRAVGWSDGLGCLEGTFRAFRLSKQDNAARYRRPAQGSN